MNYSPTLCFAGFNSKRKNFSKKEEKKSNYSSLCRNRVLCVITNVQEMAKEICHDNISSIATRRIEYRRRAMSRQLTACRDRT